MRIQLGFLVLAIIVVVTFNACQKPGFYSSTEDKAQPLIDQSGKIYTSERRWLDPSKRTEKDDISIVSATEWEILESAPNFSGPNIFETKFIGKQVGLIC